MASRQARQDRLLERQRGAGRQVRGAGLQLVLPGQATQELQPRKSGRSSKTPQPNALQPQRSSRRTPAGELAPQRSSKRTPGPLLTSQRSSRRTPIEPVSSIRRPRGRPPTTSSKKRRLVTPGDGPGAMEADETIRPSKRLKAAQTSDKVDEQAPAAVDTSIPAQISTNLDSQEKVSPKKRKKRKSIGQQSTRRPKSNPTVQPGAAKSAAPSRRGRPRVSDRLDAGSEEADPLSRSRSEDADAEDGTGSAEDATIMPTIEPTRGTGFTPHKKRKKRVSIGQQSRRKPKADLVAVKEEPEASETEVTALPERQEMSIEDDNEEVDVAPGDDADDELAGDTGPAPIRAKIKRKKRKSIRQQSLRKTANVAQASTKAAARKPVILKDTTRSQRPSLENRIAANSVDRSGSHPTQPRKRGRKPLQTDISQSKKPSKTSSSTKAAASKPPPAGTVPITIYRPSTLASATSSEQDRNGAARTARAKRNDFNAVDVLAQITLERLSKHAAKMNSRPDATRVQRKALELYTTEVEARLRQVSRALDRYKTLDASVKASTKEEKELKSELKQLVAEKSNMKEQKNDLEARKKRLELESLLGRIESVTRKAWQSQ